MIIINKGVKKEKRKGKGKAVAQDACKYCGKKGHWAKDCWKKQSDENKGKGKDKGLTSNAPSFKAFIIPLKASAKMDSSVSLVNYSP